MRAIVAVFLVLILSAMANAGAANPADSLIALVPPEAGVTVVVHDLRGQSEAFLQSALARGLVDLPVAKEWRKSGKFTQIFQARRAIEAAIGVNLKVVRDEILGDAVVLALMPPENEPRGLFLTQVRDRKSLDQLIARLNAAEKSNKTLVELREQRADAQSATYWHRIFAPGTKADEWYTILGENTFAWANSEALIQGAIARHEARVTTSLALLPAYQEVRASLPKEALLQVYVDPRFLLRLSNLSERNTPDAAEQALKKSLAALTYLGAAVQSRDGLVLDIHAKIDPTLVDDALKKWAAKQQAAGEPLAGATSMTLGAVAGQWDLPVLLDRVLKAIPVEAEERAQLLLTAANGLFLGKDLRRDILPHVGPAALVRIDAPDKPDGVFPIVVSTDIGGSSDISRAIENALKTAWAFVALDGDKNGLKHASREIAGIPVTSLSGADRSWSYALTAGRLAIGSDPQAVAATFATPVADAKIPLARLRDDYFPTSRTFAVVDLESLYREVNTRRDLLAQRFANRTGQPPANVRHDLDRSLDLIALFRAGYVTAVSKPDMTGYHLRAGLIAKPAGPELLPR